MPGGSAVYPAWQACCSTATERSSHTAPRRTCSHVHTCPHIHTHTHTHAHIRVHSQTQADTQAHIHHTHTPGGIVCVATSAVDKGRLPWQPAEERSLLHTATGKAAMTLQAAPCSLIPPAHAPSFGWWQQAMQPWTHPHCEDSVQAGLWECAHPKSLCPPVGYRSRVAACCWP